MITNLCGAGALAREPFYYGEQTRAKAPAPQAQALSGILSISLLRLFTVLFGRLASVFLRARIGATGFRYLPWCVLWGFSDVFLVLVHLSCLST